MRIALILKKIFLFLCLPAMLVSCNKKPEDHTGVANSASADSTLAVHKTLDLRALEQMHYFIRGNDSIIVLDHPKGLPVSQEFTVDTRTGIEPGNVFRQMRDVRISHLKSDIPAGKNMWAEVFITEIDFASYADAYRTYDFLQYARAKTSPYVFGEKPPAVSLLNGNELVLISTNRELFRPDIILIRDALEKQIKK